MRLEAAMHYLRLGYGIYRMKKPDNILKGTQENPLGSFYLTLFDVLAEDWEVKLEANGPD